MVEIIAICNQKGGVGKTTTAVNLSACLAAAERKTLLVDLDPQANATTGVGFDKNTVELSIYQSLISDTPIGDVLQKTKIAFLDLIPSQSDLVGAELELAGLVSRETYLQKCLAFIMNNYDYIIIDCPPSLGLLTLNALTAAHSVLIPVQCEYYAMEGLANLRQTIEIVCKRFNPGLKIKGIVLTMFDARNNLSYQVSEELRKYFNEIVFQVVIPRNVRLSEAPSYGKPIILYDVKSKGAEAYFDLAREILAKSFDKAQDKEVQNDATQSTRPGIGGSDDLSRYPAGTTGDPGSSPDSKSTSTNDSTD